MSIRAGYTIDCKTAQVKNARLSSQRKFKQSKKRSGVRVKTESETGCALQENITAAIWAFQTDFEKKTDCFAV